MRRVFLAVVGLAICLAADAASSANAMVGQPNVILIVCDDLNDYVEGFGDYPRLATPHMRRLAESGVSFTQAHCTIPICNPSRASFMTGLYPHTSQCYGFDNWDEYEVLRNSRTLMNYFRQNGYYTLGTGKLMHNRGEQEWDEFGHRADYGPFAYNEEKTVAHPWNKAPFRDDFGAIDGSFGPLFKLTGEISPENGKPFSWRTGNWAKQRTLRYESDDDRDPTGDELCGSWAVEHLKKFAAQPNGQSFFMGVGFLRPHTPLIVPQKYFDRFPLESIPLPNILENDAADTFKHTLQPNEDDRSSDRGTKIYDSLIASFGGDRELALKKFIQAYLASVASVDDLIGEIIEVVDASPLRDNTIIILTSDHGWGMGEKDYVYKNSLWQESTRVPLIIRVPRVAEAGGVSDAPVSLIDLYPTLIELCGLKGDTRKNEKGRALDGFSLKPLLEHPRAGVWDGPAAALTALYRWSNYYDPAEQSYALRFKDWRYIRYSNGKEELYHTAKDPKEWTNLALRSEYEEQLVDFRSQLMERIPASIPRPVVKEATAEEWKNAYFKKHPAADRNQDGTLSWAEYKAYKDGPKMPEAEQSDIKEEIPDATTQAANEAWKTQYFKQHPEADSDKDGSLTWWEYNQHRNKTNES